jgi:hypothetical protein
MEKCPTEIHTEIVRVACGLDDGTTARAISSTNTYFQTVASPFRFLCLSVSGIDQLEGVISLLDAADAHQDSSPLVIEHLFVCDRRVDTACSDWQRRAFPLGISGATEPDAQRLFVKLNDEAHRFVQLVPKLLKRAALTVRTLTMIAYDPYRAPYILQTVLETKWPVLEELTLRGNAWEVDPPLPVEVTEVLLPRVERVHLASTRMYQRILRQVCATASGPAPDTENNIEDNAKTPISPSCITHIRLSGLARDPELAGRIHAELHKMDLAPDRLLNMARRLDREPAVVAPPIDWKPILRVNDLQSLVIHPMRLPLLTDCACCSGYASSEEMQHVFRELSSHTKHNCLVYVRPTKENEVYPYNQARQDWIARIQGKEGCWAEKSTYEDDEDLYEWDDDLDF